MNLACYTYKELVLFNFHVNKDGPINFESFMHELREKY
jgi:hypothetical protein